MILGLLAVGLLIVAAVVSGLGWAIVLIYEGVQHVIRPAPDPQRQVMADALQVKLRLDREAFRIRAAMIEAAYSTPWQWPPLS